VRDLEPAGDLDAPAFQLSKRLLEVLDAVDEHRLISLQVTGKQHRGRALGQLDHRDPGPERLDGKDQRAVERFGVMGYVPRDVATRQVDEVKIVEQAREPTPMASLPYIDEHACEIEDSPERVWRALLATVRGTPRPPGWLSAAWGLEHRRRIGAWDASVAVGDTVPGFVAAEVDAPRGLALRGRHRFSDYELRFELEPTAGGRTRLRAKTFAAFPGLKGQAYRTVVITSGAHRVAVRRILGRVGRMAEQRLPAGPPPPSDENDRGRQGERR
jgi:hypothetical protein